MFVRFSRVAGKSQSAKIMIYRGPAGGGGSESPRGASQRLRLHLGILFFFLEAPDSGSSLRLLERR